MSENNLVPVDFNQLPSTQFGTDDQFAELAKSTEFLGRLQLYTKGKAINKGLVRPGCYGIPAGDEDHRRPGRRTSTSCPWAAARRRST